MEYVLIVEDAFPISSHLERVLAQGGFRSHLASNGQEALQLLEEHGTPLFVITNLKMPAMGGVSFAATMKQDRRWCEVPVLVIMSSVLDSVASGDAFLFTGMLI